MLIHFITNTAILHAKLKRLVINTQFPKRRGLLPLTCITLMSLIQRENSHALSTKNIVVWYNNQLGEQLVSLGRSARRHHNFRKDFNIGYIFSNAS